MQFIKFYMSLKIGSGAGLSYYKALLPNITIYTLGNRDIKSKIHKNKARKLGSWPKIHAGKHLRWQG